MTDPLDSAPSPDDRTGPVPAPAAALPAPAAAPRRRRGGWLKWWLLTSLVLVVACTVCLAISLSGTDVSPVHIVIGDGDDSGISITGIDSVGLKLLLSAGVVMLVLALMLLVPMIVMLVLGSVALALVCGLGAPLVALAIALVVVSSPIWLVGMVIWLVMRRRTPPVTIRA